MRIILLAVGIALGVILAAPVRSQTNPTFNPDIQWGNVQGSIPYRSATKWSGLPPGTAGQALLSGGAGANPYWSTLTGTGTVTSVAGSGGATGLTLSGGPITGAGTLTLGGTLAATSGGTGQTTFSTGDILYASAPNVLSKLPVTVSGQILTVLSGAPTWSNISSRVLPGTGLSASGVNTVTLSLASAPTLTIKSNITGGSAVPVDNTLSQILDAAASSARGSLLYRGASSWTAIAPGSSGEFLKTNGAGADPQWQAVSGALGGTVTSVTCGTGLTGGTFTVTGTCAIDAGATPGVANNSSASAGNVGEYVTSSVAQGSVALNGTTTTPANITSISLTAGDWDISANATILCSNTVPVSQFVASISTTSATMDTSVSRVGYVSPYTSLGANVSTTLPTTRISLNSTTTIYLVAFLSAAPNNGTAGGSIHARRVR